MTRLGQANDERFDLIIIGGGISGACLLREASASGLRALLLESADFGNAASANSLRILHGGIRHLPSMHIRKCRRAYSEQLWFLKSFPRYTRRVGCVLPAASTVNSVAARCLTPFYRIATSGLPSSVPELRRPGREFLDDAWQQLSASTAYGFAVWDEVLMRSPARILIGMLKQACCAGGTCLNYTRVNRIDVRQGRAVGVYASDVEKGTEYHFEAPYIVNCTGASASFDDGQSVNDPSGRLPISMAMNLAFDRQLPSGELIWVGCSRKAGDNTLLLTPRQGATVAGTFHLAMTPNQEKIPPTDEQLAECIDRLNRAFPGSEFHRDQLRGVEFGWLPVCRFGQTIPRRYERIESGRYEGLIHASSQKYTLARRLSKSVLRRVASSAKPTRPLDPPGEERFDWLSFATNRAIPPTRFASILRRVCEQEAVRSISDLVLRRTEWSQNQGFGDNEMGEVAQLIGIGAGPDLARLGTLPETNTASTFMGPTSNALWGDSQ